jgi:RimJ/RimL family protein N-acetyltransferase
LKILETQRLILREVTPDDAPFILELLNEPSWLRYIGDKGVRTLDDARAYILRVPVTSYARHGFGLYVAALKPGGEAIGMCGLVKREALADVDIGFAFLPRYWGQGYAFEAASASLEYGKGKLGIARIVGITSPDNHSSIKLLEKIGMKLERTLVLDGHGGETKLFSEEST